MEAPLLDLVRDEGILTSASIVIVHDCLEGFHQTQYSPQFWLKSKGLTPFLGKRHGQHLQEVWRVQKGQDMSHDIRSQLQDWRSSIELGVVIIERQLRSGPLGGCLATPRPDIRRFSFLCRGIEEMHLIFFHCLFGKQVCLLQVIQPPFVRRGK